VTTPGGGPAIVVAVDMPVPDTMITFGVSGKGFTYDEIKLRVVDGIVRIIGSGTLD